MNQLRDDEGARNVVREIARNFSFALLVVALFSYAFGMLAGAAINSVRCNECGKPMKAEGRP